MSYDDWLTTDPPREYEPELPDDDEEEPEPDDDDRDWDIYQTWGLA